MSPMLGESILPETVNDARRRVRNRVSSVRQPLRRSRQDLVPGPDIIGRAESNFNDLRNRVVNRDGLIERVREQSDMMDSSSSSNGDANNGSTSETNTPTT